MTTTTHTAAARRLDYLTAACRHLSEAVADLRAAGDVEPLAAGVEKLYGQVRTATTQASTVVQAEAAARKAEQARTDALKAKPAPTVNPNAPAPAPVGQPAPKAEPVAQKAAPRGTFCRQAFDATAAATIRARFAGKPDGDVVAWIDQFGVSVHPTVFGTATVTTPAPVATAPAPKAAPVAAQTVKAPAPAPVAPKAAPVAPKAAPVALRIDAPKLDKAALVAEYQAAGLPGAKLCGGWKAETLAAKLAAHKAAPVAEQKVASPAPAKATTVTLTVDASKAALLSKLAALDVAALEILVALAK